MKRPIKSIFNRVRFGRNAVEFVAHILVVQPSVVFFEPASLDHQFLATQGYFLGHFFVDAGIEGFEYDQDGSGDLLPGVVSFDCCIGCSYF